jgi:hypothetical protein
MLMVVTSRSGLESSFGNGSYDKLCTALLAYRSALQSDRISNKFLVPDDEASARLWSLAPSTSLDPSSISGAIRQAVQSVGDPVTDLLLVGGSEVIPFFSCQNPVMGDGDPRILTDNPYGCATDDGGAFPYPDWAVGRLVGPDPGLDSLIATVNQAAAFHQNGSTKSGGCAIGCSVWTDSTQAVANSMSEPVLERDSPAYIVATDTASDLSRKLIYFNLHGNFNAGDWSGEGGTGTIQTVSPSTLSETDLQGAIVFAANCYGAYIEKKSSTSSCALTAVKKGARAFIGATCLSFGAASHSSTEILYSDQLAQLFFNEYSGGTSAGEAFLKARNSYARQNTLSTPNGSQMNPREYKTALQFIFLGDPTL